MLDEFNKTNPYGIKARAEIAGAAYPDVYNKVNAAIQAGQPPEISVAYQNQAAFYRAQNAVIDLNPFIKSKKYGLSDDDLKDYFQTFLDSDLQPAVQGRAARLPDPALDRSDVLQRRLAEAAWLQRAAEGLEDLGRGRLQGERPGAEQVRLGVPPRRLELRVGGLHARRPHPGARRLSLRLQQRRRRRRRRR